MSHNIVRKTRTERTLITPANVKLANVEIFLTSFPTDFSVDSGRMWAFIARSIEDGKDAGTRAYIYFICTSL